MYARKPEGAHGGPWGCNPEFFNATAGLRGTKGDVYDGEIRDPTPHVDALPVEGGKPYR